LRPGIGLDRRTAGPDLVSELEIMVDKSEEQSDEQVIGKCLTRRMTTGRRVASVLEQLCKWESVAGHHRGRLGLDPLSRAKLGKDVAIGNAVAGQLDRLSQIGGEILARGGGAEPHEFRGGKGGGG
jgi:hypothetical protein